MTLQERLAKAHAQVTARIALKPHVSDAVHVATAIKAGGLE